MSDMTKREKEIQVYIRKQAKERKENIKTINGKDWRWGDKFTKGSQKAEYK